MSLGFPLARTDFYNVILLRASSFWLPDSLEINQLGSGEILTADLGPRLWRGSITTPPGTYETVAEQDAVISIIRQAGRPFFVHPPRAAFPIADPTGSILGVAVPLLASVSADRREITIEHLPALYKLTAGDFVSFSYGASPTRFALHRVVKSAVAGTGGVITIEVSPNVRPGESSGAEVEIKRARMKAVYIPGSYQAPQSNMDAESGISFDFMQTLR